MYNVLLVTDNATARKPMKSGLLELGCSVALFSSAEVLREDAELPRADVVFVDLEHLHQDTRRLLHHVKREPALKDLPLVMLVTEEQLGRIEYALGVDDYLTLPVSPKRLAERIKFLMWKLNRVEVKHGLRIGELAIDFERYEVHVKGAPVELTYKEFELLKFLATHPGRVFTREALLNKVWGYDFYGGTRTVDVHIRRLRSKIETGSTVYIDTVRNVGYKFVDPESLANGQAAPA